MAVYTQLKLSEINTLCRPFELGPVVDVRGIEDGIENSTYFVDFDHDGTVTHTVLTVFEYMSASELPPFIELMAKLSRAQLQTPAPFQTASKEYLIDVNGKPGLLFPRAAGGHVSTPCADQCAEVGEFLAKMHLNHNVEPRICIENSRGLNWQRDTAAQIINALPNDEVELVNRQFNDVIQQQDKLAELPSGIIHADLFHDNALFHEGRLSAVIDYYFACTDWFLLDLAIVANDWCWGDDASAYDRVKLSALIAGYQANRKLTSVEVELWPVVARIAMTRFWLSRRKDEIEANGRRLKSAYPLKIRLEYLLNNPADLSQFC